MYDSRAGIRPVAMRDRICLPETASPEPTPTTPTAVPFDVYDHDDRDIAISTTMRVTEIIVDVRLISLSLSSILG